MIIIGISGNAQSGKDTVAKMLVDEYGFERRAFADPLKDSCAVKYGIPRAHFDDPEKKKEPHPFWGVSPREIAQFEGTEATRDIASMLLPDIGEWFWVRRLELGLMTDPGHHRVVVSDVRFQNEVDWFGMRAGAVLLRLVRQGADGTVGIKGHRSEQIDKLRYPKQRCYHIDNNGTLPQLYARVRDVAERLVGSSDDG